ncbi:MAG: class I SAM-dependent methyltransferase [Lachnospiraceae bacterium]|nr:class I SAM-dependent methyltransferase [Lachnospiraceae bacterium]
MSTSIQDYRKMVDQPWGTMFYEQIFRQLVLPNDKKLKILDFGAGFGLTAEHYAEYHDVIALEPNEEMRSLRVQTRDYTLIPQGIEYLKTMEENSMDVVICHNVMEYTENKEEIVKELARVLKPGGILSIVKHNLLGRVMGSAVLANDPGAALALLRDDSENSLFGHRSVYSNESLVEALAGEMELTAIYGIRTFFGLSSNNEIKYTAEWYGPMLELETKAAEMEEYKKVAFFNHLIFTKKANAF